MNDNDQHNMTYLGTMPEEGLTNHGVRTNAEVFGDMRAEREDLQAALDGANASIEGAHEAIEQLNQSLAEQREIDTALRQTVASLGEEMRTQSSRHVEDMTALQHSHEVRIERIAEVLHEAGERQGWCSTYDAILADAGLPARQRDFDVSVTVTVVLDLGLQVTAGGYDAARETLTQDMVRAALDLGSHLPEGDVSWDVTEVEAVDE